MFMFCGTCQVFGNLSWARFWDILVGVVSVVAMTFVALVWNDFSTVIGFIGAFCSSYLAFVAPSVFIVLARKKYDGDKFKWKNQIFPIILASFGLLFMIFGSIAAFKCS